MKLSRIVSKILYKFRKSPDAAIPARFYYARALALEEAGDSKRLNALADEWLSRGYDYKVYGVLNSVVKDARKKD